MGFDSISNYNKLWNVIIETIIWENLIASFFLLFQRSFTLIVQAVDHNNFSIPGELNISLVDINFYDVILILATS